MNEELQTVNAELQVRVDELSRSNNDMKNLLNSTDIATLFLDSELRVRRFTTQTAKLFKLIPVDTGRPITDIVSDLDYPQLADDARAVLRSLVFVQRQVPAGGGRWFTVRIMPYHTQDGRIDGVVITFVDIGLAKTLEAALSEVVSVARNQSTHQSADPIGQATLEKVLEKAQAALEAGDEDQSRGTIRANLLAREKAPS